MRERTMTATSIEETTTRSAAFAAGAAENARQPALRSADEDRVDGAS